MSEMNDRQPAEAPVTGSTKRRVTNQESSGREQQSQPKGERKRVPVWLWVCLAVAAVLAMLAPRVVIGLDVNHPSHFAYKVNEDGQTCTITGYEGWWGLGEIRLPVDIPPVSGVYEITIPESIDGYRVTAIKRFSSMMRMAALTIPEGVVSVSSSAFWDSRELTDIVLPNSLVAIEANPFMNCVNLESIRVYSDHPVYHITDGALISADGLLVCFPANAPQTEFTIPGEVVEIGTYGFYMNRVLRKVTVPGHVKKIGIHGFHNCRYMTDVVLEAGVEEIDDGAFYACVDLMNVTIPESVRSIHQSAFMACTAVTLHVVEGSLGHQFAVEQGLPFVFQ